METITVLEIIIMTDVTSAQKVASPISTGNVGGDFESLVGAYYLAMVLLRSIPRGQDAGVAEEVRFQRLYEGEPLDDLIIISELPIGKAKLAIQVKRDLVFGEKNDIFDKVVRGCWETFKSPKFVLGIDRFGIAIGLLSKTINEHYQNVLTRARSTTTEEDFINGFSIPGLFSKKQESFVQMMRRKLDACEGRAINDKELWDFFRSMVILDFDFLRTGSRDQYYIIEILKHLMPPEKHIEPSHLFLQLCRYASEAKGATGSLNLETLDQKLVSSGFPLQSPPDCRRDLERLQKHGDFILTDIRNNIEGLTLNRNDIINDAREKIKSNSLLELIGPPGVGKSAVLKSLAELQHAEGPTIVLAGDRLSGIGWDGFSNYLRLERSLQEILVAISSNSSPCIFIDGVDRIIESGSRKVVNDLLHIIKDNPLSQDYSKHWTLVVSAREDNLQEFHSWVDLNSIHSMEQLKINDLDDGEVNIIFERNPRLKPLLVLPQLKPIIKNLFMLSLLIDKRMFPDAGERPSVASEIEVSDVWWKNVVGRNANTGRERQRALLQLGKNDIYSPGHWLSGDYISPDILQSLESDNILVRDEDRDMYRFSHDLMEEWILYRILNHERDNLACYLKEINQPFGLLRPTQLLGQSLLENHESIDLWTKLLIETESSVDITRRWSQALLIAPILSTHVQALLDKIESFLKDDNSKHLIDLIVALRTTQMDPDFSLIHAAKKIGYDPDLIELFRKDSTLPRWRVWIPFMSWLLRKLNDLPENAKPEVAKIMEIWQLKTPYRTIYRKELGNVALDWLEKINE